MEFTYASASCCCKAIMHHSSISAPRWKVPARGRPHVPNPVQWSSRMQVRAVAARRSCTTRQLVHPDGKCQLEVGHMCRILCNGVHVCKCELLLQGDHAPLVN